MGTVIAFDPDMPAENQRLVLRASTGKHEADTLRWQIGDASIGQGEIVYWHPLPGRHRIVLQDTNGAKLDEVGIQVRGLPRLE